MNTLLSRVAGLATCCALYGCFDDQVAGNTTQTENTVTARSILVDSVLPAWSIPWGFPTVIALRLDTSNFDFRPSDSAGRDIVIEKENGDSIPFDVVDWDKSAQSGRIQVRLEWPLFGPTARFLMRWSQPIKRRSDPVAVWRGFSDNQKLALTSVLMDDFEGASLRSRLPSGNSWYRAASDSTVTVSPPTLAAAGYGRSGKAIHLAYSIPAGGPKYALLGIALGSNSAPRKLRSLDSMVLWIRASGKVSIAFDRLSPHTTAKTWIQPILDSTKWTRLRIRPKDFDPADGIGNNIGWNATCDSVTNLSFMAWGGTNLWIDDVRLYGLDHDDLR